MTKNDKFEQIVDAEFAVRSARASVECQLAGVPLFVMERNYQAWVTAKKRLSDLVDSLSLDEMIQYGDYRKEVMA